MISCIPVIKKIAINLLILIGIIAFIFSSHLGYNYFTNNVHTVIPGEIYRSAQLNKKGLTEYTKKFHLKTIINLRGAWPSNPWYQVESRFAKENHLNYYSPRFEAYALPSKKELRTLVHLLQTAPKPLMFHCEGGADRTGMAAAISVILYDKNPSIILIKKQASWHYNAISRKTVGYQMLRNYFAWLKQNHDTHSTKKLFLEWVNASVKMKPYQGWFVV